MEGSGRMVLAQCAVVIIANCIVVLVKTHLNMSAAFLIIYVVSFVDWIYPLYEKLNFSDGTTQKSGEMSKERRTLANKCI